MLLYTITLILAFLALVAIAKATSRSANILASFRPFGDFVTPDEAVDFANRDTDRIQGNIIKVRARRSSLSDVIEGGTLPAGLSTNVRAIVQERTILGHSLAKPMFKEEAIQCGDIGEEGEYGSTEFDESVGYLRGRGPKLCVKDARTAFLQNYEAASESLKAELVTLSNQDIQATLAFRSGLKFVANSTKTFDQNFTGDTNEVDTAFEAHEPDSPISFKALKILSDRMVEEFLVEPWEMKGAEVLKFVGSQAAVEILRNDLDVRDDSRALVQGKYKVGEENLTGYTWEGPYRGIVFGTAQLPIRFNEFDSNGLPIAIEPLRAVNVSKGRGARINPVWSRAKYEIGLLIGKGSFRRRVPQEVRKVGTHVWPANLVDGTLTFFAPKDSNNPFGDFGMHLYEIKRSYRVEHPHHVCAIAYKRPNADLGLTPATDYEDWSSSSDSI